MKLKTLNTSETSVEPTRKAQARPAQLLRRLGVLLCLLAALGALTGCTIKPAGSTSNENAAENRQYMAQLNQKTGELSEALEQFQDAVSNENAVAMRAALGNASKIIENIKKLDPPQADNETKDLLEVKELYVEGLDAIQLAMNDYADLYADVAAEKIGAQAFSKEQKNVQEAYDKAVDKLAEADTLLTELANE